ncbi:phage tail spike protein [Lapidilactobacillus gannanensis]|uniref:Phage tail spike protein n=1 Tax=Lapidilactobacillus gannanensis TaxID=2486002 RepID=A0ABW4BNX9_9LACO|nr:phage tail spike protein [Lapidilactobacillus gannanensis]
MRWNILDRNMHILLSPDTRADASLPIYHDKQTIELKNNCAIGTYDFTVNQQDPDAKVLQLGNYISFVDKYGKTRLYTLMSHDGDEYEQTWHAEDIGLDLINEVADKWKYNEPHSFAWYAENLLLYDSGWSIGINEISNLTRSLTFDGQSDSVLTRLGDLANQFDGAEIDFEVEMSGSAVTKQVINVYKKLGSDLTQQRFVDAVNLKALTNNGSINDLRTAMIGYGSTPDDAGENAEPITFANIEYDDGRYFTLKGDKTVCDRVAGQTWARAGAFDATNKNALKGYIVGIYTYETKDANELLKRTITNLKTVNEPQIGYEADLLDLQADIGDTVQIAHRQYNPPIYLSARVQEVENCYTEAGQDTGKLGNYQILESNIDPRITDMISKLATQKASYIWLRYADDDKGNGMSYLPTGKKYYAMVTSIGSATPSDDPADYAGHWIELAKDGTPGKAGADGKTPYFHTAWADSVDGKTGFSTTDSANKSYLGTYADFTQAGSTDPSAYTWSLIKGADGKDGANGKDGVAGKDGLGIKSTAIAYQLSSSGTTTPTGTWSTTVPTLTKGQYLWTRTTLTYTDNTTKPVYSVSYVAKDGNNGSNGIAGKDGVGIKSTVVEYVGSTSGTTNPTSGWTATIPSVPGGQYLWTRTTWTYTDNTTEQGFIPTLMGAKGDKGDPGSDNVPYAYTQTSTPSSPKPKENDIWFVGTNWQNASAIKRYVGGTWVTDNFSQAVLNIKQLNAVQINGSTISGSMFVNNFDFYDGTMHYVGSMNIGNANYTVNYDLTETGVDDKNGILSISPQRFSNAIYRGKSTASPKILDTSVELFGDTLQFVKNTSTTSSPVYRITNMMSGDIYDTGWQNLVFIGGAISNPKDPAGIRRIGRTVFLRGSLRSPRTAGYIWCNLPLIFRPTVTQRYTVFAENNNQYRMIFWIAKDGNIRTEYNEVDANWYWLSGINWQMDKPDEEGY